MEATNFFFPKKHIPEQQPYCHDDREDEDLCHSKEDVFLLAKEDDGGVDDHDHDDYDDDDDDDDGG